MKSILTSVLILASIGAADESEDLWKANVAKYMKKRNKVPVSASQIAEDYLETMKIAPLTEKDPLKEMNYAQRQKAIAFGVASTVYQVYEDLADRAKLKLDTVESGKMGLKNAVAQQVASIF